MLGDRVTLVHNTARQRQRAETELEPRQRVVRLDQIAQVPVRTEQRHAGGPHDRRRGTACAHREDDDADRENGDGSEHRQLRADRQAGGDAGQRRRYRRQLVLQEQRDGGEQEPGAGDVVGCLTRLGSGEHRRPEDDDGAEHAQRRHASTTSDAPGRQEGEHRPADVHHRREEVAPERELDERVHEARVERVVGLEDVGPVGQTGEAAALDEARREGRVVPDGVGMCHPAAVRESDVGRPLCCDERCRERDRDDLLGPRPRWTLAFGLRRETT